MEDSDDVKSTCRGKSDFRVLKGARRAEHPLRVNDARSRGLSVVINEPRYVSGPRSALLALYLLFTQFM